MTSYYFGTENENSNFLKATTEPPKIKLPKIEGSSTSKLSKREKAIATFLMVYDEDWLIIKPPIKRFKRTTINGRDYETREIDLNKPEHSHLY